MGKDVQRYVEDCPQCQGKAVHRHKPYGKLSPLPIPGRPLKEFSLDWIVGLLRSRAKDGRVFDSILTVVDRYTKFATFISTRSDTTAADFAELFF